ncbi:Scr1 family TA system antitoxin-like transcriptional regulator [Nocardia goodfellowii]|uniref:DUF5753 domain-containing protein n=1 Tax=Nocardia goodfellowii TaxID=882446 RepID=A0ABS4QG56_9NOCA|nr:Scr1 family TA system antitoxin-like transcriptional regulator [Nocardia goodfellowii]MBP2190679.1 hypothetical protein [Nocardia goodfellowii]
MTHISTYTSCASGGLAAVQSRLIDREAATTLQRNYNSHIVIGLLQTPAYATAILSASIAMLDIPDDTCVEGIETVTGVAASSDARDVALAARTFDAIFEVAAYGQDARAILARALDNHTNNSTASEG